MNAFIKLIKNPFGVLEYILRKISILIKDDEFYLQCFYLLHQHKVLNLKNPQLFTEKIQWLKLYNRKALYQTVVDKIEVKNYVKQIIGEKYIIPTLFVYNDLKEIDLSKLPDQFVLKTNCGGGNNGVVVCTNKSKFNKKEAIKKLRVSLSYDIYKKTREWPYHDINKRIFSEVFMKDNECEDLIDYKFFCFNGKAEYCQVIANRNHGETIDFYDRNWNHQHLCGLNPFAKNALQPLKKPSKYEEMLSIADKLSKISPFLRVDLYLINDEVYFGEMTFFPNSGVGRFTPKEWDFKLGKMLVLPKR